MIPIRLRYALMLVLSTLLLKSIRKNSQTSMTGLLETLDPVFLGRILRKEDVIRYVLEHGNKEICEWLWKNETKHI